MPENKHLRFLLKLLYAALALAALWLALRFLIPWLLPFLLAAGLAALLEPVIRLLGKKFRLARRWAAALCTLLLSALLCGGIGLLAWRAWYEAGVLMEKLPALLAGLPELGRKVEAWLYRFTVALPVPLQDRFQAAMESLTAQGSALSGRLTGWLSEAVGGAVSALPGAFLFLFTTLLATYFISAGRPELAQRLARMIPARWTSRLQEGRSRLKQVLAGWLKAQGLLILITFGELAVGFLVLRVDPALLLAGLVALVDALPVFGTGTVLIPWAVLAFFGGSRELALGLLILYGAVTVVRNVLEPRLVGERLGLHPLLALAAMYVGFQAFGVAGMVLAPFAAVLAKGLWDGGLFRGRGRGPAA